ncbi:unnamed protein product, partial [Discosporangium mesarthrocarpum]
GISDSDWKENQTGERGGGIHLGEATVADFSKNMFTANTASYGGGGISMEQSSVTSFLKNSLINNDARTASLDGLGGGILIASGSNIHLLAGSSFSGNIAAVGGGMRCQGGAVIGGLADNIFSNNRAIPGAISTTAPPAANTMVDTPLSCAVAVGGGISADACSIGNSTGDIFQNNSAGLRGGGAHLSGGSVLFGVLSHASFAFN